MAAQMRGFLQSSCFITLVCLYCALATEEIIVEKPNYCPFFRNRGTYDGSDLKNCTWYRKESCCQPIEIGATFNSVKPPQGASPECLKQLNYLMCYICDPSQALFYTNQYLTVCSEFCDNLYTACSKAILKGSVIGEIYANGGQFCESRGFNTSQRSRGDCFYFEADLEPSSGCTGVGTLLASLLLPMVLAYWTKSIQ